MKLKFKYDFTQEEHETWSLLFNQQLRLLEGRACSEFWKGFDQVGLPSHRIPTLTELKERLRNLTDWDLVVAENEYLDEFEWSRHMGSGTWPMTDYIRNRGDVACVDAPDVFHDFFGHLPQIVDDTLLEFTKKFSTLYGLASSREEILGVSRLWWHTMEFGLIERESVKVFGAGHFSSKEQLLMSDDPRYWQSFDLDKVLETPGGEYSLDKPFFVLEDWSELDDALFEMRERLV